MIKHIATITLGAGGANAITFLDIPQIYTDLWLVTSIRTTYATTSAGLGLVPNVHLPTPEYPNLDKDIQGYGNGYASYGGSYRTVGLIPGANSTAGSFGVTSIYVSNYANSGNYKMFSCESVNESNIIGGTQFLGLVRTSTTNPIASLSLGDGTSGQNLAQYSTASLYGITKGSGGATVS